MAEAITTSVASGRCGPCASSAPIGSKAIARARSRSRTSSHVSSASSWIAIALFSEVGLGVRACGTRHPGPGLPATVAGVHHGAKSDQPTMTYEPPERLNLADHLLGARVREGLASRTALRTDGSDLSYGEVQALAHRFGNALLAAGAEPEQRVMIALPDIPEYVGALFGVLEMGGVVVTVNPGLPVAEISALLEYTRARVIVTHHDTAATFREAARSAGLVKSVLAVGEPEFDRALGSASPEIETFPSHRDDPAIWLFSGGTT